MLPGPHFHRVDPGGSAQHSRCHLLPRHLEREDCDGFPLHGDVGGDVERQRRLPHRRTGGDDHQIGGVKSRELLVEVPESSGETRDLVAASLQRLEFLQCREEERADRLHPLAHLATGDVEHRLLRAIEDRCDLVIEPQRQIRDGRAGPDQVSPLRRLLDDAGVVVDVGRRRHDVEQPRHIGNAAHLLEFAGSAQFLGDGDGVDRLVGVEQQLDGGEDRTMRRDVEVLCLETVHHLVDGVRRHEHRSEHRLLGFNGMRRNPPSLSVLLGFGHGVHHGSHLYLTSRTKKDPRAHLGKVVCNVPTPTSTAKIDWQGRFRDNGRCLRSSGGIFRIADVRRQAGITSRVTGN